MEKTRSMKGEKDEKLFFFRQTLNFSSMNIMTKVLFPICTLNWHVNIYVSCQGKGINRRNENTIIIA